MKIVPAPQHLPARRTDQPRYPFAQLKVGEAFYIAEDEATDRLRTAAGSYMQRHPLVRLSVRADPLGGVWCIRLPSIPEVSKHAPTL